MNSTLSFSKMNGLGNDFIIIDGLNLSREKIDLLISKTPELCDRRFSIGGDGVILLLPAKAEGDFKMTIINSDGSEAEMCGNGVRCFAKFAENKTAFKGWPLKVETRAGLITVEKTEDLRYRVDMGKPRFKDSNIPESNSKTILMNENNKTFEAFPVSMGNPHAVLFEDKGSCLSDEKFRNTGAILEYSPLFKERTNVEFTEIISDNEINLRVWERGCGSTLACGTGACASVVAGISLGKLTNNVTVHLPGGDLIIEWSGAHNDSVYMTGVADSVFSGTINLQ